MTSIVATPPRTSTRRTIAREGAGWLEKDGDRLVLHTRGTPYEEGFQHGKLLRDQVRSMWQDAFKNGFFKAHPLFPRQVWQIYAHINERSFSAAERSELHGVADGAGLRYEDVVLMNTEAPYSAPAAWLSHGCTQVFARGAATRDGGTLIGRNLDAVNLDRTWKHQVLMVHHPAKGHAWMAPGTAGRVLDAVTGWNDAGLVIAQNDAENRWPTYFGLQSGAVMRRIMEQASNAEEARAVVAKVPAISAAGSHVTLVQGNQAEVMEIRQSIGHRLTLGRRGPGEAGDRPDTLVITNHYTSPAVAAESPAPSVSSATRRQRAQSLMASDYGRMDVPHMMQLLTDKRDLTNGQVGGRSDNIVNWNGPRVTNFGPWAISPDVDVHVSTTYSTVADIDRQVLWVAGGKPYVDSPSDYRPFDVQSELSRQA